MSKMVTGKVTCLKCESEKEINLYGTIWGEDDNNRALGLNDGINVFHCDECGFESFQ